MESLNYLQRIWNWMTLPEMGSSLKESDILTNACTGLLNQLAVDRICLIKYDLLTSGFIYIHGTGLSNEFLDNVSNHLSKTTLASLLRGSRLVSCADILAVKTKDSFHDLCLKEGVRAYSVIIASGSLPSISGPTLVLLFWDTSKQWTSEEEMSYQIVAQYIGSMLMGLNLYKVNRQEARTDTQSGLPNGLSLVADLQDQILKLEEFPLSLIVADFFDFKRFYKGYGNHVADLVMPVFARYLRSVVPQILPLYHIRSDKFGVILPQTDEEVAMEFARRLCKDVEGYRIPFFSEEPLTLSIGVLTTATRMSVDSMIAYADKAAYEARQSVGSRIVQVKPESSSLASGT